MVLLNPFTTVHHAPLIVPISSPQLPRESPAEQSLSPVLMKSSWQRFFWKLLQEPQVTDATVDQSGRLWIDHGRGLNETSWSVQPTPDELHDFAIDVIAAGGRHLDSATPVVDTVLPEPLRMRVHAALPAVTGGGAVLSFRKPAIHPKNLAELGAQFMTATQLELIREAIQERHNILLTGASGSGKTTTLAAILGEVDERERIIAIEDIPELNLTRGNFVQLCARQANSEGVGRIATAQLLLEALRMRPDRIVLGELRGAEFIDLLTALNTGHDGGAASCHASSLASLPSRLEAMGALAGLPAQAVAQQVIGAIHLVIHVERHSAGRRVASLGKFFLEDGLLKVQEIMLPARSCHERKF